MVTHRIELPEKISCSPKWRLKPTQIRVSLPFYNIRQDQIHYPLLAASYQQNVQHTRLSDRKRRCGLCHRSKFSNISPRVVSISMSGLFLPVFFEACSALQGQVIHSALRWWRLEFTRYKDCFDGSAGHGYRATSSSTSNIHSTFSTSRRRLIKPLPSWRSRPCIHHQKVYCGDWVD